MGIKVNAIKDIKYMTKRNTYSGLTDESIEIQEKNSNDCITIHIER